jgi:PPOX class probable F420-dependent enzyme
VKENIMSSSIPENFKDLFSKKTFAQMATIMADGTPQVTPVWFDFDGTHFLVNSARGRVKDKNVQRNPNVALNIQDPDNPYRYLAVKGKVVDITETGADAHIDSLAKKYLGKDKYPWKGPGEVRVIYKIKPERVSTMG